MQKFYCKDKSTITVTFTDKPIRVEVYTDKGKVYFFRELGGKHSTIKFNICHKGHYKISEDCKSIEVGELVIIPVRAALPPRERNRAKPFTIVHNDSMIGTPARINTGTGIIETGKSFKTYPFPIRLFILCHEIGHFFYSSEEAADLFACKIYVNNGYNKSNALYALTKVLHAKDYNQKRILEQFKNLQR